MEEGLAELAGEDGLREIAEVLLHHVRHVECGLALEAHAIGVRLHHLPQELDPRFHSGLTEQTNLGKADLGENEVREMWPSLG